MGAAVLFRHGLNGRLRMALSESRYPLFGAMRRRPKSNKPPARHLMPDERPHFSKQIDKAERPKNQAFAVATKARASLPISAAGPPGL
jgi:hypothetical protein